MAADIAALKKDNADLRAKITGQQKKP
jgi:hypothetical protein